MTDEQDPAADAAADALSRAVRSTPKRSSSPSKARKRSRWAGSAGFGRDPQLLSQALEDLLSERGWQDDSAIAQLMTRWEQIVGPDLASHVTPVSFDDGALALQAESTTWATQVRLLLPDLQRVIDAEVGAGVVTVIRVQGPQGPSWVKGPRHVKGRGPRDTYG